jgi:hypothetical protein
MLKHEISVPHHVSPYYRVIRFASDGASETDSLQVPKNIVSIEIEYVKVLLKWRLGVM